MNFVEMDATEDFSVLSSLEDTEYLDLKREDIIAVEDAIVLTVGAEEEKPSRLDNILTLSLVAALILAVIAVVIRKVRADKKPAEVVIEEVPDTAPEAPGSAGQLKLHDTDPKTAAMLMAVVADKLQKPLNELRFISIKEVE